MCGEHKILLPNYSFINTIIPVKANLALSKEKPNKWIGQRVKLTDHTDGPCRAVQAAGG